MMFGWLKASMIFASSRVSFFSSSGIYVMSICLMTAKLFDLDQIYLIALALHKIGFTKASLAQSFNFLVNFVWLFTH